LFLQAISTMRQVILVATLLLSTAAFAIDPAPARDPNIDMVALDLHAVGRVATVAEDLGRSRQILLAIVDSDIKTLRGPRDDGSFKYASLQREEGGRVSDEKTVEHVYTEKELRYVTVTAPNGYRVEVTVPKKRGTFQANNRVWVRNVIADSTGFDGKTSHQEIPVNAWVNPGDSTGVALADIGKSVKATVELGVESGNKAAAAQVSVLQAKLVDDPTSPYFPAVKRLLGIRDLSAAKEINRGQLRNTVDEALLSLPGELEKRTAEQARMAEERKRQAEAGYTTGQIALGDATPDVTRELAEITRLMNGTVQEQADGRTRLQTLIDKLTPKMQP
jgi:hypothetical protein